MIWDGGQTLKLLIHNYVMSSSKGCRWVLPNTLSNFTLPLGMSSWRRDIHHLERRGWRRRDCMDWWRNDRLIFLFVSISISSYQWLVETKVHASVLSPGHIFPCYIWWPSLQEKDQGKKWVLRQVKKKTKNKNKKGGNAHTFLFSKDFL